MFWPTGICVCSPQRILQQGFQTPVVIGLCSRRFTVLSVSIKLHVFRYVTACSNGKLKSVGHIGRLTITLLYQSSIHNDINFAVVWICRVDRQSSCITFRLGNVIQWISCLMAFAMCRQTYRTVQAEVQQCCESTKRLYKLRHYLKRHNLPLQTHCNALAASGSS